MHFFKESVFHVVIAQFQPSLDINPIRFVITTFCQRNQGSSMLFMDRARAFSTPAFKLIVAVFQKPSKNH